MIAALGEIVCSKERSPVLFRDRIFSLPFFHSLGEKQLNGKELICTGYSARINLIFGKNTGGIKNENYGVKMYGL